MEAQKVRKRDSRSMERKYEQISPFEFKNKLISLAEDEAQKGARAMLNAGRGNPNWIAAAPREAFFALGQFAVQESRRVWDEHDLAGMPSQDGIAARFKAYVQSSSHTPGAELLKDIVDYGINILGFNDDAWVHELVDGIIGDNYPVPDRMLVHMERVVHDYLIQELCNGKSTEGKFDVFAVEGATAAMCYIFETLQANYILSRGDKIAIMVPIFPPYVEIPNLARYDFEVVEIRATGVDGDGLHNWTYPTEELEKLKDPSVKALFLVNPSNPPSVALDAEAINRIIDVVKHHNPNLMIITDDVYSTFVDGFRSLMADLPQNTIGVYSFSKYFGVTGWRLGAIMLNQENVFDQLLQNLPDNQAQLLHKRYESLSEHPEKIRFIDRVVADSRQVALNHTAGLSTPQQVQMALFAGYALLERGKPYKQLTKDICRRRMKKLYAGLGLPEPQLTNCAYYYTAFDLAEWASHHYGEELEDFLKQNYEPVDILFRLAEKSAIVLLNVGGFHGPKWSIRVSLANLEDDAYSQIGQELHNVLKEYVAEWQATKA